MNYNTFFACPSDESEEFTSDIHWQSAWANRMDIHDNQIELATNRFQSFFQIMIQL